MHKEDLWCSLIGINKEIHLREVKLNGMRAWLTNAAGSVPQYSIRYIYQNGPKIAQELLRLKVIRVEVAYLYNLKVLGI